MWEGWEKSAERDTYKSYELLVKANVSVSLLATFTMINSDPILWGVEIVAFNPLAGEYILYQDVFSDLPEAEKKTWQKSQEIVGIYHQPTMHPLSMGTAVPPPSKRKRKSLTPLKWKDWNKVAHTERIKSYSLRVETKDKTVGVRAALYLPDTDAAASSWVVVITTQDLPEGKSVTLFTGVFREFMEAEEKAWEEAQKAVNTLEQKAA